MITYSEMNHDQVVLNFYRVVERTDKSKIPYWQKQAHDLALSQNKPMAVVTLGNTYQVWPKDQVGKSYEIVYVANGGGACG
jgi:hypothetical protein